MEQFVSPNFKQPFLWLKTVNKSATGVDIVIPHAEHAVLTVI